jgi:predicted nucleic acid-binding protein
VIVADASLITYLCIDGEQTALAESVFGHDGVWVAPVLWRSEFRNTLAKYLHHGLMGMESALISLQMAEEAVAGREYAVDSRAVLELAAQSKCTAYDCEYVALAQDLGVPLVTTDKQILRAFPKTAASLEKFAKKKK